MHNGCWHVKSKTKWCHFPPWLVSNWQNVMELSFGWIPSLWRPPPVDRMEQTNGTHLLFCHPAIPKCWSSLSLGLKLLFLISVQRPDLRKWPLERHYCILFPCWIDLIVHFVQLLFFSSRSRCNNQRTPILKNEQIIAHYQRRNL